MYSQSLSLIKNNLNSLCIRNCKAWFVMFVIITRLLTMYVYYKTCSQKCSNLIKMLFFLSDVWFDNNQNDFPIKHLSRTHRDKWTHTHTLQSSYLSEFQQVCRWLNRRTMLFIISFDHTLPMVSILLSRWWCKFPVPLLSFSCLFMSDSNVPRLLIAQLERQHAT